MVSWATAELLAVLAALADASVLLDHGGPVHALTSEQL